MNVQANRWFASRFGALSIALAILTVHAGDLSAQCRQGNENPWILPTAPLDQFKARDDGTVIHKPSRLVWQRCVLGQNWNGSDCEGTPASLNWSEALDAAESHVQDAREDWRLPNRNELVSILESRCFLPAIDELVFPDAPSGAYWTSSPVSGAVDESWIVDFDDGLAEPAATGQTFIVRLVRGGWE